MLAWTEVLQEEAELVSFCCQSGWIHRRRQTSSFHQRSYRREEESLWGFSLGIKTLNKL